VTEPRTIDLKETDVSAESRRLRYQRSSITQYFDERLGSIMCRFEPMSESQKLNSASEPSVASVSDTM